MLARLAVRLLCQRVEPGAAARNAVAQRLAGLFLDGDREEPASRLDGPLRQLLRRAAQREAADEAVAARETAEVLGRLTAIGLRPAVLKGRALAPLWLPSLRPAGDLDLLLPPETLEPAAQLLTGAGYRRAPVEPPSRLRRRATGIELVAPPGRSLGVDLHARPFRSVGHQLSGADLLSRARPVRLDGQPVLELDPADRLLFVYVHAAKHGVRALKWLLDLHVLGAAADAATWHAATGRALASDTARPFWAAARLAALFDGASVPKEVEAALRPPRAARLLLSRLFTVESAINAQPLGAAERYGLEVLLEPGLWARARMAAGLVERLVTPAPARR